MQRLENYQNNPRTAIFAKRLIYEHALEEKDAEVIEKYRREFQEIVKNKNASGRERDDALEALIKNNDWENSDRWYLGLFEDETLLELSLSESGTTNPLDGIVYKDPDKWIPVIANLVGNENQVVHNAAVNALVQFQNESARRDALLQDRRGCRYRRIDAAVRRLPANPLGILRRRSGRFGEFKRPNRNRANERTAAAGF